jgi:hypothetical protein
MEAITRSDLTALASLVIAAVALWRSLVAPARALRTSVLRDVTELRVEIEALEKKIPLGVQSRQRVLNAAGGLGGNFEIFKNEATADSAEVETLKGQLVEIETVRRSSKYDQIEEKATVATAVRTRVRQLTEKYSAAMAADDALREFLRNAVTQRALQQTGGGKP